MSCNKYRKVISAYIDSEVSAIEEQAMQAHIKSCAACKQELSDLYMLRSMVQNSYSKSIDIDLSGSIMAKIDPKVEMRKPGRWRLAVSVAAGLMVAAAATGMLFYQVNQTEMMAKQDKLEKYVLEHVDRASVIDLKSRQVRSVRFEK